MATHIESIYQVQTAEVAIPGYRIVKAGTGAHEVDLTGADEKPYGVAQVQGGLNNSVEIGDKVEVAVAGGAYVEAGGVIAKGASVKSGANGVGLAAGTGEWAIGIADEVAASGDVIGIRIMIHKA